MKKYLVATAIAVGCMTGSAQAAPTITAVFTGGATTTAGTVYQSFDSFAANSAIPGATLTYAYSSQYTPQPTPGPAANPYGGPTGGGTAPGNYAAVQAGGSFTTTFGGSLFSFVLGSLDSYNSLVLNTTAGSVTLVGGQILTGSTASPTSVVNDHSITSTTTNGVITYQLGVGQSFTSATFTSSQNAFEFDNLSAVPEPAAWGMMILGFGLVGGVMRRRQSVQVKFA